MRHPGCSAQGWDARLRRQRPGDSRIVQQVRRTPAVLRADLAHGAGPRAHHYAACDRALLREAYAVQKVAVAHARGGEEYLDRPVAQGGSVRAGSALWARALPLRGCAAVRMAVGRPPAQRLCVAVSALVPASSGVVMCWL